MEELSERKRRFAEMHAKARVFAGKSQEYVANEMNVSKRTVCNWENATSIPSGLQTFEYFEAIGLNPAPYIAEFMYKKPNDEPTDNEVEESFAKLMPTLPAWIKRYLLFIFFGRHGSSPVGLLHLTLAHIHSPLKSRVVNAQIIKHNFEMAKDANELVCEDNVMPDMVFLDKAINQGRSAAINNEKGYFVNL